MCEIRATRTVGQRTARQEKGENAGLLLQGDAGARPLVDRSRLFLGATDPRGWLEGTRRKWPQERFWGGRRLSNAGHQCEFPPAGEAKGSLAQSFSRAVGLYRHRPWAWRSHGPNRHSAARLAPSTRALDRPATPHCQTPCSVATVATSKLSYHFLYTVHFLSIASPPFSSSSCKLYAPPFSPSAPMSPRLL